MAFNPFHWFRKRQKVVFAGLIFVCMLVFIGSFGAGDPFQLALGWFGTGKYGGATVIKLQGHGKVTERDLAQLSRQRKMASDFLLRAASTSHDQVLFDLKKEYDKSDASNPLGNLGSMLKTPLERLRFFDPPPNPADRPTPPMVRAEIQRDLGRLERLAQLPDVKDNKELLAVLQRVATLLGFQAWQMDHFGLPPQPYFGGARKTDDLLDFLMWKSHADKLGIVLTDDDVRRAVNGEA